MMKKRSLPLIIVLFTIISIFSACKKVTDTTELKNIDSYLNLRNGKYIIYKLDSTITVNFGTSFVTHSSIIKDSIGNTFLDNTNRLSYTIFRYQFDANNNTWNVNNTFYITPTSQSAEYVENNFRYFTLANPISINTTWAGNKNVLTSPYYANSNFSDWKFSYKNIDLPFTVGSTVYPKTITVVQYDSTLTDNETNSTSKGAVNLNAYATFDKGYEIYADSVGLIYKDIMSWNYQISPAPYPSAYSGYGITQRIISHN